MFATVPMYCSFLVDVDFFDLLTTQTLSNNLNVILTMGVNIAFVYVVEPASS